MENANAAKARVFCNLYAPVCNDAGGYLSPVFRRLTFSTDIAMVCCQDASVVQGHGRDFDQSQAVSSKIPMKMHELVDQRLFALCARGEGGG